MNILRPLGRYGALLGTLHVLCVPLWAQAAQDSARQAVDSSVVGPRPIPAGEVIPRADSLDALLRAQRSVLSPEPGIAELDSLLGEMAGTVAALVEESDSSTLATASSRVFDDLRIRWERRAAQIAGWQRTVDDRSQRLDSLGAQLRRTRAVWEVTRDSSVVTETPEAVRERLAAALMSLDSVETELRARVDSVLTVANRVSRQQATVTEALLRLDAAELARRQRLLTPEQPPIWRAFGQQDSTASVASHLRRSWQRDRDVFWTFVHEERDVLVLRLVLLALMAIGLSLLHARRRTAPQVDPSLSRAVEFIRRPISGAFLLFLLSGRLFHPAMPQVYSDLNALLLMVPLARMIPVVAPKHLRPAAYGLVGIFSLQEIGPFFVTSSVFDRLIGLGVNLLLLAGLGWFARPEGPAEGASDSRWWTLFLVYVRAGIIGLALAFMAHLVGMVDLADLLTSGIVIGLIAFFLLVVGTGVVRAAILLSLQRPVARLSGAVRHRPELIAHRLDTVISVAALVWWLSFMLDIFRVRDVVLGGGARILAASLTVGSIDISFGDVLAFGLVIWLSFQAAKLVRFILEEDVLPRVDLPRGVPRAVTTFSGYIVVALGFGFAVAAAGFDLSQITLLAGAFGVGIGFGLQGIVNNFVSGLILMFEGPIQVGDIIEVDSILGTAQRIGIRASVVRTFDGAEVIVPNADLTSGRVINWSLSDRLRRIEVRVGVAYGTDPQTVLELLTSVAEDHDRIAENPAPVARFLGFGDSSLDFSLWAWSSVDEWVAVASDLHVRMSAALDEAGIEIPFPQRDLHIRSGQDDRRPPRETLEVEQILGSATSAESAD